MPEPAAPPRGEVAALVAVQSALADRPGVLAGARGLSHFGEHSLGWLAVPALGALLQPRRRRRVADGRGRCVRRARRRGADQAGGAADAAASSGRRGQRRHPEPAELPVRARHVDDRGGHPAGPRHRAAAARVAGARRWRCRGWCSVCTTRATSLPASSSARPSRRRSAIDRRTEIGGRSDERRGTAGRRARRRTCSPASSRRSARGSG